MKYKTTLFCLLSGIVALGFSGLANARITQTITFNPATGSIAVGAKLNVTATASSGLTVSLSRDSSSEKICSLKRSTDNAGSVTGLAAGICKLNAIQEGSDKFASVRASLTISVQRGQLSQQTISFGAAPQIIAPGTGTVTVSASSGLPVILTSTSTSVCTVSGNSVTGLKAGICTIAANQAGNGSFAAAPQVTQSFNITQSQTISFGTAPKVTVSGKGTVTATASSGLAVTLTSLTPTVCSVSGNTVTGLKLGTCTIAANQAGNTSFIAAPQATQSFSITQKSGSGGIGGGSKLAVTPPFDCNTLASSGNAADDGRRAYIRLNCASCHGQDGSGSMGPDIRGEGGDVSEVLNGEGAMPSYAGFLCPNDAVDLQAYLNSISKTAKYLDWDAQLEQVLHGTAAPTPTSVVKGP